MAEVLGPLGRAVTITGLQQGMPGANALLVLNRCAVRGDDQRLDESAQLAWAVRTGLGHAAPLADAAHRRRHAAARSLAGQHDRQPAALQVRHLALRPQTALLTGTGEAGIRNVGLALHGTYGWPVLRGSTLKGVTHAYARDVKQMPRPLRQEIFGTRPDAADHEPGTVTFLDAVWHGTDCAVAVHVLTPHFGGYYADRSGTVPPAEYNNPVPVSYLAVTAATFLATLIGPADAVDKAQELLTAAVDDLGVGAKTAAGYGYLDAEETT
ncbi:type III-B CRISPR module RAMP protein Cmr6 [Dactylosporangium sp. NPDC049525]|uniref:type III-B CRISPR module RAMP protein Cmr6 n=1 Tax=Dactylosporangium sp. NPDC049525 TaxID=3154730 RepID=UPI003419CEDF